MPRAKDLTNQKFGNLTAIEKLPSRKGKTYWLCICDCGEKKEVQTGHLTSGAIKTCGKCQYHDQISPIKKSSKGKNVIAFRKRIKIALVAAFGGKCAYCGLEDDPVLYDFHHINPELKEFGIGNATTTRSKQAYADEAKKCILLCSNCHRRIENSLIDIQDLDEVSFDETIYYQVLEELIK